jgi:hypothetical protein
MSTESHSLPPLEYPLDCLCLFGGSWCLPCLYSHCLWLLLLTLSVSVWWFFVPTCIYSCCLWLFAADCRLFVSRWLSVMMYLCVKLPFLTVSLLSVFYIFVYICHSSGRACFFYISSGCLCLPPGYFFRLLAVLLYVFLFPTFLLATSVDWLFVTWLCANVS